MPETNRCPDCGHENPPGVQACEACNFPLTEAARRATPEAGAESREAPPPVSAAPEASAPEPGAATPAGTPEPFVVPRVRIARPRRPRPQSNVALTLWLGVGAFCAMLLVFIAVQANMQREQPPVEGSSVDQQKAADAFRAVLAGDSTNVDARVGLADVLFDTGNWSEAAIHYRSAVRQDSSRVPAIVDLGVCYYNLSQPAEAERMFRIALARDPHHPFALFNLGIVHERQDDPEQALQFFHRALQSAPPEEMKPAILEAMQRMQKQTGKVPGPLEQPR